MPRSGDGCVTRTCVDRARRSLVLPDSPLLPPPRTARTSRAARGASLARALATGGGGAAARRCNGARDQAARGGRGQTQPAGGVDGTFEHAGDSRPWGGDEGRRAKGLVCPSCNCAYSAAPRSCAGGQGGPRGGGARAARARARARTRGAGTQGGEVARVVCGGRRRLPCDRHATRPAPGARECELASLLHFRK